MSFVKDFNGWLRLYESAKYRSRFAMYEDDSSVLTNPSPLFSKCEIVTNEEGYSTISFTPTASLILASNPSAKIGGSYAQLYAQGNTNAGDMLDLNRPCGSFYNLRLEELSDLSANGLKTYMENSVNSGMEHVEFGLSGKLVPTGQSKEIIAMLKAYPVQGKPEGLYQVMLEIASQLLAGEKQKVLAKIDPGTLPTLSPSQVTNGGDDSSLALGGSNLPDQL